VEISRAPPESVVTREALARKTSAPTSVLAQALARLVHAGILTAQTGRHGGYRLARNPDRISICDVMIAIDGRESDGWGSFRGAPSSRTEVCPLHPLLVVAEQRFLDELRGTSLADLTSREAPAAAAPSRPPPEAR
jgi:Rrf2 family protein